MKRKSEETIFKICSLVFGEQLARFASNLVCRFAQFRGILAANLIEFREEISELHRCENCGLCFPANVLMVWCNGFLSHMAHYRASLFCKSLVYIISAKEGLIANRSSKKGVIFSSFICSFFSGWVGVYLLLSYQQNPSGNNSQHCYTLL